MRGLGLSARDRRTLATGAGVIAVLLLLGKALPALRRWETERVAVARELREELAEAERNAAAIVVIRDSAQARTRRLDTERGRLIRASTAAGAAAALGRVIETVAGDEGVDVQTITLRPDTIVRHGLARVAVRFGAEGDVEGLANLLFALESDDRPMAVRELSVTQTEPGAPPSRVEALRFDLTVETLARIGPPATKTTSKGAGR